MNFLLRQILAYQVGYQQRYCHGFEGTRESTIQTRSSKKPMVLQLALTEYRFIFGFRAFLIVANELEMSFQMLMETFEFFFF